MEMGCNVFLQFQPIYLIYLFLLPLSHCVKIASSDASTLLEIKEGRLIETLLPTWLETNDCSEWEGISCDESGSVTKINLTMQSGLFAKFPTQIGNLTNLRLIDFSGCSISENLPSSISFLSNLEQLYLQDNILKGALPQSICYLKTLKIMDISGNQLSSLPSCISNLTSLQALHIGKNTYTKVPSGIGELKLTNLKMDGLQLAGALPSFLSNITTLELLDVSSNKLSGGIPSYVCEFANLSTLVLSGNELTGLPACISSLSKMKVLQIAQNFFSDATLTHIFSLTSLEELTANNNLFNGIISPSIENLKNLQILNLASCKLNGTLPSEIFNLPQLSYIDLKENRLLGSLSPDITKQTKLTYIDFGINILNGSIPDDIGNLVDLNSLLLNSNNLTGSIPSSLSKLTSLTELNLRFNHLEGGLESLNSLTNLATLILAGNNFDKLPSNFTGLTLLNHLDLSYNNFDEDFPPGIGSLTSLSIIKMQGNNFKGSIPSSISNLPLEEIYLFKNRLEGRIPSELFQIESLSKIYLNDNKLTGSIPSLSLLTSLQEIVLDNNELNGTLPATFPVDMPLTKFAVSNNKFTGRFSANLAAIISERLALNDNQLSGLIPSVFSEDTNLEYINLANNNFSGSISQLEQLKKAQYIYLGGNKFTESFQNLNFSGLSELRQFVAPNNQLSGDIPRLVQLPSLKKLDLSSNQLSGSLPTLNSSLQYIDLSDNKFAGSVNFKPSNFPDGSFISLKNNGLTGSIPDDITSNSEIDIILAGNPACSSSSSSVCGNDQTFDHKWSYTSFCEDTECEGGTSPSPSVYNSSNICFCAGHLQLSIELSSPPFSKFEDSHARLFQELFLKSVNEDGNGDPNTFRFLSQIQVVSAQQTIEMHQLLEVKLYSEDGGPFIPRHAWQIVDGMFMNRLFIGHGFGPSTLTDYKFVFRSSFTGVRDESRRKYHIIKAIPIIAIIIVIAAVLAIVSVCLFAIVFIRKNKRNNFGDTAIKVNQQLIPAIGFKVIEESTNHFSESNKIGTCGSSFIYRGKTREGNLLAVKRNFDLNNQTARDFKHEVETLSKLRNSSLLRLIGYCNDYNEQICVFDFVPNGTLWEVLHSSDKSYPIRLGFRQRIRIAYGAAEGLNYLVNSPKYSQIKHIVNSHNIFIDNNLQAIVSVFEFKPKTSGAKEEAAFTEDNMSMVYIDPEFINTGKLTPESIVYSFGVVLLELISGKKPIVEEVSSQDTDVSIVDWAKDLSKKNKFAQIIDPSLGLNYSMDSLRKICDIALQCVDKFPSNRPSLHEVVRAISEIEGPHESPEEASSSKMRSSLLTSSTRSDESV